MNAKKLLVVEDDPSFVALVRLSLRDLDFDVEVAEDGLVALNLLTKSRFDLVMCDYHLPHIDGAEIIKATRKSSPNSKIVLISATSANAIGSELEKLPLSGFIQKPCSPVRLREVIAAVL